MHTYTPADNALTLWRCWLLLICLPLFILSGFLWIFLPAAGGGLLAFALAAGALAWFWYLPRLKKSYRITLSAGAVTLTRGVLFRRQYLLPCPRLIYVEKFSTPLSLLLGMRGLRLRAARGRLTVPALSEKDIEDFLNRLHDITR